MSDINKLLDTLCSDTRAYVRDRAYEDIEASFREFRARAEKAEAERDGALETSQRLVAELGEAVESRQKVEAERDAAQQAIAIQESLRVMAESESCHHVKATRNARAWARRWKRAARWYRNLPRADASVIDDLISDLTAANAALARYRSAERRTLNETSSGSGFIVHHSTTWVRLPEGEE